MARGNSLSQTLWITNVFGILGELSVFVLELCIFHDGSDNVFWESKAVRDKMKISDLLFLDGCDSHFVLDEELNYFKDLINEGLPIVGWSLTYHDRIPPLIINLLEGVL